MKPTVLSIVLVLVFVTSGEADRSLNLLLAMDQHLVRADFIARVTVTSKSDSDVMRVGFTTTDVIYSRWELVPDGFTLSDRRIFERMEPGRDYVVLLSGGPWMRSPLTHREHSLFEVMQNGELRCYSHNPLFAVHNSGFWCDVQENVATGPLHYDQFRSELEGKVAWARRRLPALDNQLNAERRALATAPSATTSEVVR